MKKLFLTFLLFASCSSTSQFGGMQNVQFSETPLTQTKTMTVELANPSQTQEQRIELAGFEPSSNNGGNFRIDKIQVGNRTVAPSDIVIPPSSVLKITVSYTPLSLQTSEADYAGWSTGKPERWTPQPVDDARAKPEPEAGAIHRALLQLVYDHPQPGIVYVQLIGYATPGPNGETEVGGKRGECEPGNGMACYFGGFAIDIPELLPNGPQELVMTGMIPIDLSAGAVVRMDEFPAVLMYLRSTEIPQLPSGVTATMIITGAPGKVAQGSFDGTRLTLSDVAFRIQVVLGELQPSDVTPGMSAIVDFVIEHMEISTTEPLNQGNVTLHLETQLSEKPSGNDLFDQFLANVHVILFLKGQLVM